MKDAAVAHANNLPAELTSFIGRTAELADLTGLLAGGRLVTVTGAAGCGKTRLALQAAATILPGYPDGVWLAELSPVTDAAFVGQAVATVLEVREDPGMSIVDSLAGNLRERQVLLVLDGCEHVVEAAAQLADELLRRCPKLRVLATSRESLRVPGEMTWRIPSLAPGEAVALFLDRARLADPGLKLEVAEKPTADLLCRRLDGIPLAIELAAAHVRVMSVGQILERLEDRFRLLTGGSRTAVPRQQTLRAAVDWSYDRLNARESLLFRRLSVFSGGFAMESLEAVCCDDAIPAGDAVELLSRLADKSLVVPEARAGAGFRYGLLETLREYGREQLAGSGEADALWRRHAAHFVRVAEAGNSAHIAEERANLAGALEFLRAARDESGLRLAVAMVGFWDSTGHVSEGRERLEEFLESVEADAGLRARALDGAGWLAFRQADMEGARRLFERARDLLARSGGSAELARVLSNLGLASALSGELDEARRYLEESLQVGRGIGVKSAVAGSLWVLGMIAYFAGDLDESEERARESLLLAKENGDRKLEGFLRAGLGIISLERGRLADARRELNTGLEISVTIGDRLNIALLFECMCRVGVAESAWAHALRLGGAAAAMREGAGAQPIPIWQDRVGAACERARRALGASASVAAFEEGRSLEFSEAVNLARGLPVERMSAQREAEKAGLTKRELEIAMMVAQGMTNRDMAKRLFISQRTVEGHVENIRSKLGFRSRTQIAAWAVDRHFSTGPAMEPARGR